MKKLHKLLIPFATLSVATLLPTVALANCGCSNTASVELADEVKAKGVSLKSFSVNQGELSVIDLNLPTNTLIGNINLKIVTSTLSKVDVSILNGRIIIPANKMTTNKVLVSDIALETIPQPEPEPTIPSINFESCSWSQLDELCQKLEKQEISEAEFCSHVLVEGKAISSLEKLIGLTKTVKINNREYTVKVVATLHDTISSDDELNNKKAVFTFELQQLLSDQNGDMLITKWYYHPENHNYLNSELRVNLNGSGEGTQTWDKTALEIVSDEQISSIGLANAIKPTVHYIGTRPEYASHTWNEEAYVDKLYIPSYQNLTTVESVECKETKNTTFKYYSDIEKQSLELGQQARIKKDLNDNSNFYWVASPYAYYGNDCWAVETDGILHQEGVNHWYGGAVAFAFAI